MEYGRNPVERRQNHANYDDQAPLRADGESAPMRQTERAVRADAVNTLRLVP